LSVVGVWNGLARIVGGKRTLDASLIFVSLKKGLFAFSEYFDAVHFGDVFKSCFD